jgi:hypothetical protein
MKSTFAKPAVIFGIAPWMLVLASYAVGLAVLWPRL